MPPSSRRLTSVAHAVVYSVAVAATPLAGCAQSATPAAHAIAPVRVPEFKVERIGRGRPMILIPGLLSGGEVWKSAIERYGDRYDMHVLTLAGFAGAPPITADSFLATERNAIIRYIRDNHLEKPVLVGHSLGAFLAFWIAATQPELVGSVVAVDGVPYYGALNDTSMTPERARPQAEQMRAMAATLTSDQLAMQMAMALRGQSRDSVNVRLGERWGRTSDPATMGRAVAEIMTTDLRREVAEIRTPVLLIASGFGMTDTQREMTLARYRAQVSRVPNHRVLMATNARHFVMLDDPAFLFAAMDEFLGGR
jgi:N-formylmaleamate deformylase